MTCWRHTVGWSRFLKIVLAEIRSNTGWITLPSPWNKHPVKVASLFWSLPEFIKYHQLRADFNLRYLVQQPAFSAWHNSPSTVAGILATGERQAGTGVVEVAAVWGGGGPLCLEADVGNSWQRQSLVCMCVSFYVSVFVKDSTGSKESKTEWERKRGEMAKGGLSLPESKQRQQAAALSSVTEAPQGAV